MIIQAAKSTPATRDRRRAWRADRDRRRDRRRPLCLHPDPAGDGRGPGIEQVAGGLIASANFLGYLAGGVLVGLPSLPGGQQRCLLSGLAISTLTTAAMGLVITLPAFLVLRFVGGMASAFVLIVGSAFVLEYLAEAGRDELSAVHFAGVGSGIAVFVATVLVGGTFMGLTALGLIRARELARRATRAGLSRS